jgi:hypothetical protein
MRGKDYNAGLRGVLFEAQHHQRMGAAIWLYGWLVLRQTHQSDSIGWVLGGSPISYREIEEETGFNSRTLERWMRILRGHKYIETEPVAGGVIVRITKAKKFPQGGRKAAGGVRNSAGCRTQPSVPNSSQPDYFQHAAARIRSSSISGSQERLETPQLHRDFHSLARRQSAEDQNTNPNRSCLGSNRNPQSQSTNTRSEETLHQPYRQQSSQEMWLRQRLLKAERDEAVRRELAVGTGPEVKRQ